MASGPTRSPQGEASRDEIAARLDAALAARPADFNAICQLGSAAQRLGMAAHAARALAKTSQFIVDMSRSGNVELALQAESAVYHAFVRSYEIEEHYENAFSVWREPMAALGRSRAAVPPRPATRTIGFVLPSGVLLGHTEVLFRLLEARDATVDARIYVFGGCNADFLERARKLGVAVISYPESRTGGAAVGYVPRLEWLRERMREEGVATAVWVSAPVVATFAFAMRIAPVQVFWTLRYHPVRLPEIDGYITYGSWSESERVFHGQAWTVCPVPLALDPRLPPPADVAALRSRFPEKCLLGTLAREEKIHSADFLASVVEILRRHPECGYLWTGQSRHAGIDEAFRAGGVHERCHFVGWVDTPLYAAALDLFLETFPLGCGITGYQALAAGVPLLSFALPNTVFGMQYWRELMDKAGTPANMTREMLDAYPVLCARDGAEYAALASRLVGDPAFRAEWQAREARFFAEEIAGIARYSRRFFDTLAAITTQALQP
ncbi:MAG TPA: glycosyltransferase [Usitatibacter sp.]|nr:glycosyltransferase [Usitatibacter sp.]